MVSNIRTPLIICPNPLCHKKIKEPILLTTPREHYYACPHCFIEINAYTGECMHPEESFKDSVTDRTAATHPRNALDILAPNRRFRNP